MTKESVERYERTSEGCVQIDVATDSIENLYNNFDRSSPYIRRDLDQNLVDYLIECAAELSGQPLNIRFTLNAMPDDERLTRVRRSVNMFFMYLVEKERQKLRRMMRRAFVLLCAGIAILFLAVWVGEYFAENKSVIARVFTEGLTVAAWVSLWEALATLLLEWRPYRRNMNMYARLANARLTFRVVDQ